MKRLYISDETHKRLTEQAKAEGRTLQYYVESVLMGGEKTNYTSAAIVPTKLDNGFLAEQANAVDNDAAKLYGFENADEALMSAFEKATVGKPLPPLGRMRNEIQADNYYADKLDKFNDDFTIPMILKQINDLESIIENSDTTNQDPDYWDSINLKTQRVKELWAKYHSLKGE